MAQPAQSRDGSEAQNPYASLNSAGPVNDSSSSSTSAYSSSHDLRFSQYSQDGRFNNSSDTSADSNYPTSPSLILPPIIGNGNILAQPPSVQPNSWNHFAPSHHNASLNDPPRLSVIPWSTVNSTTILPPLIHNYVPTTSQHNPYLAAVHENGSGYETSPTELYSPRALTSGTRTTQAAFEPVNYQGSMLSPPTPSPPEFPWPLERKLTDNGLICDGLPVTPKLHARMEKGFARTGDRWTCYRRNYFEVSAAFTLDPPCAGQQIYLHGCKVQSFGLIIASSVDDPNTDFDTQRQIEIVQFTPKRDNKDKRPLRIMKVWPGRPLNSLSSTNRSGYYNASRNQVLTPILPYQEIEDPDPHPFPVHISRFANDTVPMVDFGNDGYRKQYAFERLQFKTATANNGKRRATQQFYRVKFQLFADTRNDGDIQGKWTKIAEMISGPVVVRGRSPNHYKDEDKAAAENDDDGPDSGEDSEPSEATSSPAFATSGYNFAGSGSTSPETHRPNYGGWRGYYPPGTAQYATPYTNTRATTETDDSNMFGSSGVGGDAYQQPQNSPQPGYYTVSPGPQNWSTDVVPRSFGSDDYAMDIKIEDPGSPPLPTSWEEKSSFFSEAMDEDMPEC